MNTLSRTTLFTFTALAAAFALLLVFLPIPADIAAENGRATADGPSGDGVLIIDNARWFDGERMQPPAAIVVRDGRIAAIESPGGGPSGARRIDATGRTLLPGLIDAHVHTFGSARRDALRFGVTTLIDMFTAPALLASARTERDAYDATGEAALFSAGMLATVAGGHGTQYGVAVEPVPGPADAQDWVDRRLAEGSDFIKLVYIPESPTLPSLDAPTAAAVIEAAHRRGVLAVAHVSSLAGARDLLAAGIDGFVHIFADQPADEAFISAAVEQGVFVVPTLAVIAMADGRSTGPALIDDPGLGQRLSASAKTNLRQNFGERSDWARLEIALDNVRRLHAAGVPVLAGSDAPNPGTAHGATLHAELELLVRAGLAPEAALAAATSEPASRFGTVGRGEIAPGARADLLLVDGRPDQDVTATRAIAAVIRNGHVVEHDEPAADAVTSRIAISGKLGWFDQRLDAPPGLVWTETSDAMMGGRSSATLERVPRNDGHALRVDATVHEDFAYPWAGAYLGATAEGVVGDLGDARSLAFDVRGTPGDYRLMLFVAGGMGAPPTAIFPVVGEWRRIEIRLADVRGFEPDRFAGMAIVTPMRAGTYGFEIDNVVLLN